MEVDMFWLHAGIIAVSVIIAYSMYIRTLRIKSTFNLYRVRDQFVFLVASGVLSEDDKVFKHFYERINFLLKLSPQVGLDDVFAGLFSEYRKSPERFYETLKQSKTSTSKLATSESFNKPEVKAAAVEYYRAIKMMVLCHSSILRLGYLLSHFALGRCINKIAKLLPRELRHGVGVIEFAEDEARAFAS